MIQLNQSYVKCPFYERNDAKQIRICCQDCEPIVFENQADKQEWKAKYCSSIEGNKKCDRHNKLVESWG